MTIIDAWHEMTTCRNCCKGNLETNGTTIDCFLLPAGHWHNANNRCDSGAWLFKGDYSGRNYFPMDLWKYLRLCADTGSDLGISVIPREEWPEVKR